MKTFFLFRASLTFRLMPQSNAVLDCSPIAAAGHVIQQNYQPICVSQFMDDLSAEEDIMCSLPNNVYVSLVFFFFFLLLSKCYGVNALLLL